MGECKLSELKLYAKAVVRSVRPEGAGMRLSEIGLVPGVKVEVVSRAPWGDPLSVKAGNMIVALRRNEADLILVEPENVSFT
jgi:ferrous iron transport protein A